MIDAESADGLKLAPLPPNFPNAKTASDKDGYHLSKPTMCKYTVGASYTKFFVNTVWLFNSGLSAVRKEKPQALGGSEACLKTRSSGLCQDLSPACLQLMPFSSHPLSFPSATRTHCGDCTWSKLRPIAVDPGQVAGKETGSPSHTPCHHLPRL